MIDPASTEEWRQILNGEIPGLHMFQRILRKIPSEPRCKLCYAPFGKPGNLVIRLFRGTAARLTSMAKAGEIVISDAAVTAAGLDTSGLERRTLELRGREQAVDAWVQPATSRSRRLPRRRLERSSSRPLRPLARG
jgi:hypothetical protein